MANKKNLIAAALLCAAGICLTACDEVVAKPGDYTDPIVLNKDNVGLDIPNNEMQKVYDQIRNGTLASDVLSEFLYQYAVSAFGPYNHVTSADKDAYTLKDAARAISQATSNNVINVGSLKSTKANEFIKNHKAYWTVDDDGNRIHYNSTGAATTVDVTADADELEYARVLAKWNTIEDRIATTLYNSITSGSYTTRNVFRESEYVWSLYSNMRGVIDPTTNMKAYVGLIRPEVEDYDVFNKKVADLNGNDDTLLHRENYQEHYELTDSNESKSNKITYIEEDIIPDIYRTLLVEQYLLDESYPTLGRSYARKVNIVKITGSSTYSKGAAYIMNAFVDNVIFNDQGKAVGLDEFKLLSSAWTGAFMSQPNYQNSEEYALWKLTGLVGNANAEYEKTAKDNTKYILGTAYGDMMEKYDKIDNNPNISENESEFTGSNSYAKEVGKEISTREIELKDNTTTGWFIKSTGLSELPETIKNRVFNIAVANAVNASAENKAKYERRQSNGTYAANDYSNYVARINGKCYLKVGTKINNADPNDDILFVDGDSYYIVQIEEAVSSSKLSRTEHESYLKQENYGANAMEDIVNEVVKIVADSDSYRTLSKKFWLKEANLSYHDTVVYDYFVSNFPELFED